MYVNVHLFVITGTIFFKTLIFSTKRPLVVKIISCSKKCSGGWAIAPPPLTPQVHHCVVVTTCRRALSVRDQSECNNKVNKAGSRRCARATATFANAQQWQ